MESRQDKWSDELVRGLRAPFAVLERARAQPGVALGYAALVRRQLLVVILLIGAVSPMILDGVRLAESSRQHNVSLDDKGLHIEGRYSEESDEEIDREPDDDDDAKEDAKQDVKEDKAAGASEKPDARRKRVRVSVAGQAFIARHLPWLLPWWLALVAFYAAWVVVELFVYALFREHVDQLSDELARRTGVPARVRDRLRGPPRIRLDFRWMYRRAMRQAMAVVVFGSGAPFFLLAKLLPHALSRVVYPATLAAWGAYSIVVTTAAKSDAAWAVPASREPFFRRGLRVLTTRVPGFRWWLPRTYGRVWARLTGKLDRAAEIAEAQPLVFLGLSVVRVLANLPILSISFLRPLLPVAATALAECAPAANDPPEKMRTAGAP